jgi:hypothetical protein
MPRQTQDTFFERDNEATAKSSIDAISPFDDINSAIEKFEKDSSNSTAIGVNVSNELENSTNILNQVNAGTSQPIVPVFVPTYRDYHKPPPPPYTYPYTYPYVVPYVVPQPAAATQAPTSTSKPDLSVLVTPPIAPQSASPTGLSPTAIALSVSLALALAFVAWYVYKSKRRS